MSFPSVEPIPENWEMRLDDTTNTYYFINHALRSTQWQHPVNKLVYRPANGRIPTQSNGRKPAPISIQRPATTLNYNGGPPRPDNEVKNDQPNESLITNVLDKAKPLMDEVNDFKGVRGSSDYLRLMESLELLILELDGVGVDGQESVRTVRRAAVREIQQAIDMLELKVSTGDDVGDESIVSNNGEENH